MEHTMAKDEKNDSVFFPPRTRYTTPALEPTPQAQEPAAQPTPGALEALIDIAECFWTKSEIPDSAKEPLIIAAARIASGETPDAAFGRPLKKGQHREAEQHRLILQRLIFDYVRERLAARDKKGLGRGPRRALTVRKSAAQDPIEGILEDAGEKFGVSATTAEKYYYAEYARLNKDQREIFDDAVSRVPTKS
jgi:hypothetical protein